MPEWNIAHLSTNAETALGTSSTHLKKIPPDKIARFAFSTAHSNNLSIPIYFVLPKDPSKCHKALFTMHGRYGNAAAPRNAFAAYATDQNLLIVAPKMLNDRQDRQYKYTLGNMTDNIKKCSSTTLKPSKDWTFCAIPEIFRQLQKTFPRLSSYDIYGHSAGAQFAYRNALFTSDKNLKTTIVANAGWWTFPDKDTDFPYGIKGMMTDSEIKALFSKRIIIIAGENDIQQKNVRQSCRAQAQGKTRYERAKNLFSFCEKLAKTAGYPLNWTFHSIPNLTHNSYAAGKYVVNLLNYQTNEGS